MAELTRRQKALMKAGHQIDRVATLDADALGFGPKCLVTASLPYQNPKPEELENGCWVRRNGNYTLWISAGPSGIPFGSYPRIFAIWLTGEAIRTGNRRIETGSSYRQFCRTLRIDTSTGVRGAGRYMRESIDRLLSSRIGFREESARGVKVKHRDIAEEFYLWWDIRPDQTQSLQDAYIVLTERFFEEITAHYIPLDLRAVTILKRSPLALDIYQWLAYRNYSMKPGARAMPTWEQLRLQFGGTYKRSRDFRAAFCEVLIQVKTVYPEARIEPTEDGVLLLKSPTPIPCQKALEFVK